MVKQGDRVRVNGIESTVETQWCQSRDRIYKLADGRTVGNLDKLIESGKATLVGRTETPPIRSFGAEPRRDVIEPMPTEETDLEE